MSQPSATRRRGRVLIEAIYLATLQELARSSFAELSFDKIAVAAGTGKAALYRRWSGPDELVLAALSDTITGFGEPLIPPRTGSLRADLIVLLTRFVRALDEPRGAALRPLLAYRHQHPELFDQVWASVIRPAQEVITGVMTEAAAQGEADPARVTARSASVGPRLLLLHAWLTEPADDEVTEVVDEILIPLLSA